jgi:hypothetical protein
MKYEIYWSCYFVLPKYDIDIPQTHCKGQFVEHKLLLSSSFKCDPNCTCSKYDIWISWSYTFVLPKYYLDVQQTHLKGPIVEQKLVLSSSFRCDQINKC